MKLPSHFQNQRMKAGALFALLILAPALAFAGMVYTADISEALTGAAPTTSTEGVPMDFSKAYRITVCAPSGQTLSGAGTLQDYYLPAPTSVSAWARNSDLDLTVSASGVRCQTFSDVLVGASIGRLRYVGNGITVSSGTTVTVHYELGN